MDCCSVVTPRNSVDILLSDFERRDLSGGRNTLDGSSMSADERCPQRSFVGASLRFTFITALTASVPDRHNKSSTIPTNCCLLITRKPKRQITDNILCYYCYTYCIILLLLLLLLLLPVILIIRSHRRTTYVDAIYCYRMSSVVCRSVTVVSRTKNG